MSTALLNKVKAAASGTTSAPAGPPLEDVESAAQAPKVPETIEELEAAEQAAQWLRRFEGHFEKALPSHIDVSVFFGAVRDVLPRIARCTPASQLQALLTCARFGLIPDGHEAVVTADGRTAVFIPTYHGYLKLMYQSGLVESVHVGMIHEADEWHLDYGAAGDAGFSHRPALHLPKAERGPAILAYAFCRMRGGGRSQVIVISREDAEAIRDEHSQAYLRAEETGKRDSFWHLRFDDMWLKTGLRRMAKYVPTSPELNMLTAAEDAGDEGMPQVVHAPDSESERLRAEAERAARHAEGSQEPARGTLAVKVKRGRSKPKRNRGGRRR
ncbi:hypothetical protein SUDANB1_05581 [Streptomyces sp. enrichment culture]|uniref:recombinase RecT n=1 Tax=Streptomyces sp. enrichment culture TaxID=1795815 RepID=UPI003F56E72D